MSLRDAIFHIPLGAAMGGAAWGAFTVAPPDIAAAALGALGLFLRELDQAQAKHDYDFFSGWAFWKWGSGKNLEWALPGAILIGLALAL